MTENSSQAQPPLRLPQEALVSIIVPFYNARDLIVECVESLLSQNYPEKGREILLVDNASSDGGAGLLEKYKSRITLVIEEKKGHGYARNRGIASARGDIIAFLDSDCVADKNWLKHLISPIKLAGAVAVGGEIKAHRPQTDVEIFYEGLMSQKRNLSYKFPYAVTANLAFLKSVTDKVSFDSRFSLGEDVDFCWRLQEKGYRIVYQPAAVVYHKNVKTRWQLFKKIFVQSYTAPKVIKKNLRFLERGTKLQRVSWSSYGKLLKNIARLLFQKNRAQSEDVLDTVFLLARKAGLLCGSLRNGFLYI